MGVPEAVVEKVGSLPDLGGLSKEDLLALCRQLYDQSCAVFEEKFAMEHQAKCYDEEIRGLEAETAETSGTFKIPQLKKITKKYLSADNNS